MIIAVFTDTYEPQINGVVTSIKLYNEELRKKGHEVHIFCPADKKLKKSKFVHPLRSIEFKAYPSYKIGIPTPSTLREIGKFHPDVIHIQSPASIGLVGLSVAKAFKIPVVMTYHTLLTEYAGYLPGGSHKRIKRLNKKSIEKYVKLFFSHADIIIAPGTETKQFLKKLIKKKLITVMPTGIKIPRKLIKKKKNKIPIILQVGRLCKERSVDVVIMAFTNLLEKMNAKLIITSDGPAEKELKGLVRDFGIQKNVVFTGFVSEKRKNQLYKNADIFVSASLTDTQGIVPLEAMAFGTPIVVPNAGGFNDFIRHGKNGLMFKPGDYIDLSKKMQKLIKNKKLRDRIIKNIKKTVNNFEISKCTKKLEGIYYSAIYRLFE